MMRLDAKILGVDGTILGIERWGSSLYVTYLTSDGELFSAQIEISLDTTRYGLYVVGPGGPYIIPKQVNLLKIDGLYPEVIGEGLNFQIRDGQIPSNIIDGIELL